LFSSALSDDSSTVSSDDEYVGSDTDEEVDPEFETGTVDIKVVSMLIENFTLKLDVLEKNMAVKKPGVLDGLIAAVREKGLKQTGTPRGMGFF
jgi:hypothetical protein